MDKNPTVAPLTQLVPDVVHHQATGNHFLKQFSNFGLLYFFIQLFLAFSQDSLLQRAP